MWGISALVIIKHLLYALGDLLDWFFALFEQLHRKFYNAPLFTFAKAGPCFKCIRSLKHHLLSGDLNLCYLSLWVQSRRHTKLSISVHLIGFQTNQLWLTAWLFISQLKARPLNSIFNSPIRQLSSRMQFKVSVCEASRVLFCSIETFSDSNPVLQDGHINWVQSVEFHPAGNYLTTVAEGNSFSIWGWNPDDALTD